MGINTKDIKEWFGLHEDAAKAGALHSSAYRNVRLIERLCLVILICLTLVVIANSITGYAELQQDIKDDSGHSVFYELTGGQNIMGTDIDTIGRMFGVPMGLFDQPWKIFVMFIIPLLVVFILLYDVLKGVNIFHNPKTAFWISVLFTAALFPSGMFMLFMYMLISVGATLFALYSVLGVLLIAAGVAKHKWMHKGTFLMGGAVEQIAKNAEANAKKNTEELNEAQTAIIETIESFNKIIQTCMVSGNEGKTAGELRTMALKTYTDLTGHRHHLFNYVGAEMKNMFEDKNDGLKLNKNSQVADVITYSRNMVKLLQSVLGSLDRDKQRMDLSQVKAAASARSDAYDAVSGN